MQVNSLRIKAKADTWIVGGRGDRHRVRGIEIVAGRHHDTIGDGGASSCETKRTGVVPYADVRITHDVAVVECVIDVLGRGACGTAPNGECLGVRACCYLDVIQNA